MVDEVVDVIFSSLEKNLRQQEEQYRLLVDAMPDALYSYSIEQGGIFFFPGGG